MKRTNTHPPTQGSGLAVIITLIAVFAVATILYFGFNYFESQQVLIGDKGTTTNTVQDGTSTVSANAASKRMAIGASDDATLDSDIAALDDSMNGASDENAHVDAYLQDSADTF